METTDFICRKCTKVSGMKLPADERRELFGLQVLNMMQPRRINFYCEHCGTANAISISSETLNLLMILNLNDEK